MPSTSRSTDGKGISPSTSTERFVPFMLSKKAMRHSTWDLGGALSNSDRTRQCASAASRYCTALWWIGIFRHDRKREANRRSSLRAAEAQDQKRISGPLCRRDCMSRSLPVIGLSESTTSELQEFCAKERLCQGKFPLNTILPPLRAALAISIDECGSWIHKLWSGSIKSFAVMSNG